MPPTTHTHEQARSGEGEAAERLEAWVSLRNGLAEWRRENDEDLGALTDQLTQFLNRLVVWLDDAQDPDGNLTAEDIKDHFTVICEWWPLAMELFQRDGDLIRATDKLLNAAGWTRYADE